MLKKIIKILCIIIVFPLFGVAQLRLDTTHLNTYVFENFINGTVLYKSGSTEQALLNYNSYNQSIAFKKNDEDLTLTNLEEIDTFYIQNRKFVPVGKTIYEITTSTPSADLYITYTFKSVPVEATTDHNGTSNKASGQISNTVSSAYLSRRFKEDYLVVINKNYWFRRYNTFYKTDSEKQLLKIFPGKSTAIKNFLAENHINFKEENDLKRLLLFCKEIN